MEMQFGGSIYLVREAVLVDFEAESTTFVVAVKNEYIRDQLQYPFYRTVRRIVSDVFGRAAEVRFVAKADWSLPPDIKPEGG